MTQKVRSCKWKSISWFEEARLVLL